MKPFSWPWYIGSGVADIVYSFLSWMWFRSLPGWLIPDPFILALLVLGIVMLSIGLYERVYQRSKSE